MDISVLDDAVTPFTKWVGGKRKVLKKLLPYVPHHFETYYEPFVGGGAMYFTVGRFARRCYINDLNEELINAYIQLRDELGELKGRLSTYIYDKDFFMEVRNRDRDPDFSNSDPVDRAVRLIYLLRVCFNGLYRVNKKNHFNTPFGRYDNPKICRSEILDAVSEYLNTVPTEISCTNFASALEGVDKNSFVYFDPPYYRVEYSSFTAYQPGSKREDPLLQQHLHEVCCSLDARGVRFMQSNSDCEAVRKLYADFKIVELKAATGMNSDTSARQARSELLILNY